MDMTKVYKCWMFMGSHCQVTLILALSISSIIQGSDSVTIKSIVLPYDCSPKLENGECKWSNWTRTCLWPQTDLESDVGNVTEELVSHGCQAPQTELGMGALKRRLGIIFSTTLLKRVQQLKPCGACSFRLRCCNKAPDFLHQSLDAFQCTGGAFVKACMVDALSSEEIESNRRKHPDWPHLTGDMCDFNQLLPVHQSDNTDPTSRLIRNLMCSFYGTSQPTITCTRLSNFRCQCCCNGFVPTSDGFCVTDPVQRKDPLCQRDETESASCLATKTNSI